MAHKNGHGGISTTFTEGCCPTPSQNSNDWGGNMGNPIEGQGETKGQISGVQFVNIKDGAAGSKGFGPGKK